MKGLLVKNFIMMRKSLVMSCIVTAAILIFMFFLGNISYIIWLSYLFIMTAMMYPSSHDYWKWERWSLELPVTRKMIVTSKYLVSFITVGASTVLNGIICLISAAGKICELNTAINVLWVSIISSLLYVIVCTPLILKLPVSLMWVIMGINAGLMGGFTASANEIPWQTIPLWFELVSLTAVMLLIPVSWLLSVKIYEKKDI